MHKGGYACYGHGLDTSRPSYILIAARTVMHKDQVQRKLESAYHRWKENFDAKDVTAEDFSPPLLLQVTDNYCRAPLRIVVYGKETKGWKWTHCLQEIYPEYPNNWPFQDLRTLADFLAHDDAIKGLIWGYEQFAFAQHQPTTRRSPFWRAFKQIQKLPDSGVLWSNLVRVDQRGDSISTSSNAGQSILRQQRTLLYDELKALRPTACIFFTGPDYEEILKAAFPHVEFKQIDAKPERELARLAHDDLPINTYRTFHPQALQFQGKWDYLDSILKCITQ
jgi:hypothetical protein